MYVTDVNILSDLDCTIHYRDGSEEQFTIPAPNGDDNFSYKIKNKRKPIYRDGNKNLRKGRTDKDVVLIFNYSSHRIDLRKLLLSEYIDIDFGDFYVPFEVTRFQFKNDSISKNWVNNLVLGSDGDSFNNANFIPSGPISIELHSYKESVIKGYPYKVFSSKESILVSPDYSDYVIIMQDIAVNLSVNVNNNYSDYTITNTVQESLESVSVISNYSNYTIY